MKRALMFLAVLVCLQVSAKDFVINANSNKANAIAADVVANGGQVVAILDEINVIIVSSDDPGFLDVINGFSGVQSAAADMEFQFTTAPMHMNEIAPSESGDTHPGTGDDDFLFDLQWGHDAIDASQAWSTGVRGAGARVAVLDGGFDLDHPDLAPNLNLGLSANFVPGETLQYVGGVGSHGTHVAGTVAAADNGVGVIGVAPEAELVVVKVLRDSGSGSFAWLIQGIVHAANADVDVINMSLGASIPRNIQGIASLFTALQKAANFAHQSGAILIAAAGNDSADLDHDRSVKSIPAELANVVSVSATSPLGWGLNTGTDLDTFAFYSNYGQNGVDLAGPGGTFEGLFLGLDQPCTVVGVTTTCFIFDFVLSTGNGGGWYWNVGTSMASPHVAGVAALIVSKYGGDVNPAKVLQELRAGAEDLGKPGNDDFYGQGRVNAYNSVIQ